MPICEPIPFRLPDYWKICAGGRRHYNIIITTRERLKLDADAISVGQPLIHLLGRIMQLPKVKPYLPFDITLMVSRTTKF